MLHATTVYNGIEMSVTWPPKIRAAQKQTHVRYDGHRYPRIPYGQEPLWAQEGVPAPTTPCRDCGVLPGQLHVPICCVEACPRCTEGQRLTCDMEGCPK